MPVDIHFLRPWVLVLLPLVPLCWLLLRRLPSTDAWQQLLAPHLYRQLLAQQPTARKQPWLLPLMLLLGILAGAGPSWQKLPQPAFQLKRATVLVLDMSMSMRATDIKPNRVTQARFKALDFAREQLEGEMALLAFAGDAYVISPLTPDHNNISLLLPDLKPEIMPVQGSNLEAALVLADQLLKQGGYVQGDVVLFTDGFASSDYPRLRELMDNWPHRLSVLAFGSTQGAPVRLSNGELLKDNQGAIVLPRVPLAQLQQLAELRAGVFAVAGSEDTDVEALLALKPLDKKTDSDEQQKLFGDQWQDNAVYLVWLLLPLALWLHKRGALTVFVLVLFMPKAEAFEWSDLWQTQQQKAQQSYQQGDYSSAWQNFEDPLWKGNAAYRAQDYAAAEQSYRQLDTADAAYNLGNSLAQQQKYQQAIEAYQQALAAACGGPVTEGAVGGGTGMICHEFKGGIGTSSRVVGVGGTNYTVGVLVQANFGRRPQLTIAGVPVGRVFLGVRQYQGMLTGRPSMIGEGQLPAAESNPLRLRMILNQPSCASPANCIAAAKVAKRPALRASSHRNSAISVSTPIRPNSSPMTESRKSVWASGSQCSFSTLPPRPTPKISPRPNAISECESWYPLPSACSTLQGSR